MSGSQVGKMLLGIFVGVVIKIATYFLTILISLGLFWIITKIPVLSFLANWLFYVREDSPGLAILFFSLILTFLLMRFVVCKVCGNSKSFMFAMLVIGIIFIALHIYFLVVNIIAKENVVANIFNIIYGIVCIFQMGSFDEADS